MKPGTLLILTCAAAVLQTTAFAADEYTSRSCRASASVSYFQRGAEAEVETTIDNRHCGASSGDFVVELTVKADADDEAEKVRFEESWDRDDDQPVVITRRYPIGDNADLLRIGVRELTCACKTQ